tara:strand:- start:295 stop:645 length:351 start_codon:yes stop_codon:yes gene_type:complete
MTEVTWEMEPPRMELDDVPDASIDWTAMRKLNESKWQGIRKRTVEVGAVDQAMYLDLLTEIIHLSRTPASTEAPTPPPKDSNLELALIKVLAGKILDCEHGTTLISTVAEIMSELQ